MGIDAGFDMYPALSKSEEHREAWSRFIEIIKQYYENDEAVEIKPYYIEFKKGEHPMLPFEGHKFLRFSSKISGSHAEGVWEYIQVVTRIAKEMFGFRVHPWNEISDNRWVYDWSQVNDSWASYKQTGEPDKLASSASNNNATMMDTQRLFRIEDIPGKGKGLIAICDIPAGTRILSEKPLFTTRSLSTMELLESTVTALVKALSKDEQRQFLSLHNNYPGKYPFSGIVKTNALPCGEDASIGGVYPTICRINHECLSNAHHNWNNNTKEETIHAMRPIKKGEEITISYAHHASPHESRRIRLKESFGFDCNCDLCSLPPNDIRKSDDRRAEIVQLDSLIGDGSRVMRDPADCLAKCHRLRQLLDEEYKGSAPSLLGRLYYDAFQISITHGDQARASIFAERAYKLRLLCEGEDSAETTKLKGFMNNPSRHRNFGASNRWKRAKSIVPKKLDSEAFEKWLWRL